MQRQSRIFETQNLEWFVIAFLGVLFLSCAGEPSKPAHTIPQLKFPHKTNPLFKFNESSLTLLNHDLSSGSSTSVFGHWASLRLMKESLKQFSDASFSEEIAADLPVNHPDFPKQLRERVKTGFEKSDFMTFYLGSSIHAVVIAFQNDGRFIILDSMSGTITGAQEIANLLNSDVKIKNHDGKEIEFAGDYISTGIQASSNSCTKFAAIYGFYLAKTKRLDAWKELEQGLSDGKIISLHDLIEFVSPETPVDKKINVATMRSNAQSLLNSMYYYSALGIDVPSWKDIPLNYLVNMKNDSEKDEWIICGVAKNLLHCSNGVHQTEPDYQRRLFLLEGSKQIRINTLSDLHDVQIALDHVLDQSIGNFYDRHSTSTILLIDTTNNSYGFFDIGSAQLIKKEIVDGVVSQKSWNVFPFNF